MNGDAGRPLGSLVQINDAESQYKLNELRAVLVSTLGPVAGNNEINPVDNDQPSHSLRNLAGDGGQLISTVPLPPQHSTGFPIPSIPKRADTGRDRKGSISSSAYPSERSNSDRSASTAYEAIEHPSSVPPVPILEHAQRSSTSIGRDSVVPSIEDQNSLTPFQSNAASIPSTHSENIRPITDVISSALGEFEDDDDLTDLPRLNSITRRGTTKAADVLGYSDFQTMKEREAKFRAIRASGLYDKDLKKREKELNHRHSLIGNITKSIKGLGRRSSTGSSSVFSSKLKLNSETERRVIARVEEAYQKADRVVDEEIRLEQQSRTKRIGSLPAPYRLDQVESNEQRRRADTDIIVNMNGKSSIVPVIPVGEVTRNRTLTDQVVVTPWEMAPLPLNPTDVHIPFPSMGTSHLAKQADNNITPWEEYPEPDLNAMNTTGDLPAAVNNNSKNSKKDKKGHQKKTMPPHVDIVAASRSLQSSSDNSPSRDSVRSRSIHFSKTRAKSPPLSGKSPLSSTFVGGHDISLFRHHHDATRKLRNDVEGRPRAYTDTRYYGRNKSELSIEAVLSSDLRIHTDPPSRESRPETGLSGDLNLTSSEANCLLRPASAGLKFWDRINESASSSRTSTPMAPGIMPSTEIDDFTQATPSWGDGRQVILTADVAQFEPISPIQQIMAVGPIADIPGSARPSTHISIQRMSMSNWSEISAERPSFSSDIRQANPMRPISTISDMSNIALPSPPSDAMPPLPDRAFDREPRMRPKARPVSLMSEISNLSLPRPPTQGTEDSQRVFGTNRPVSMISEISHFSLPSPPSEADMPPVPEIPMSISSAMLTLNTVNSSSSSEPNASVTVIERTAIMSKNRADARLTFGANTILPSDFLSNAELPSVPSLPFPDLTMAETFTGEHPEVLLSLSADQSDPIMAPEIAIQASSSLLPVLLDPRLRRVASKASSIAHSEVSENSFLDLYNYENDELEQSHDIVSFCV